jgi:peptidoglycan/LPS O-acetylase OafA/YrhL
MITIKYLTDKLAIGLSVTCAIHCLVTPIILLLLPSIAALQLNSEAFHLWMIVAVVPTSIFALFMGCRRHEHYRLLVIGSLGLVFLVLAIVLGEKTLGEFGEKILTLIGAVVISFGHYQNFRLCEQHTDCHSCENKDIKVIKIN